MKEAYFSPDSLEAKARLMLQQAAGPHPKSRFAYEPGRSALLVLDMQAYFLEADSHAFVPSARSILAGLARLVNLYAASQLPVIFTRHLNTVENARLMASWWQELILEQNPLSEITPQLDSSLGIVLKKPQYDAFYQTDLDDLLKGRGVSQVVIGGVMTHLCCETTARSAFMRGFEVFFLVDGTATYTEAFHQASLTNLSHGFAQLKLLADIESCFAGSGPNA